MLHIYGQIHCPWKVKMPTECCLSMGEPCLCNSHVSKIGRCTLARLHKSCFRHLSAWLRCEFHFPTRWQIVIVEILVQVH